MLTAFGILTEAGSLYPHSEMNSDGSADNRKVVGLIAKIIRANPDQIPPSAGMGKIDRWDSLAQLSILSSIEQEFGIEIDPDVAVDLTSVESICSFLAKR